MAIPALVKALRPKQWAKNVLVAAAPFAAGRLLEPSVAANVAVAFVAFCLASSAVYLLNDVRDAPKDRLHPEKKNRPIASGQVAPSTAVVLAVVALVASLALSTLAEPALLWVIVTYLVLQLLYVFWLKNQPVLDLAVIASGFLLRALAGGAATDIAISDWFLLVAGFGSLFVVAGKRYSELVTLEAEDGEVGQTRSSLLSYTSTYLRFVWTVAAAVTVMVYGLWVITVPRESTTATLISLVPFTLGLLVYALVIDSGKGGEPETAILRNPTLLALGALWVISLGVTLYV
ncbi:MAG: decaprenyl-phosphate phosphoribosyltransferase [Actinobacteria bacterium]|nr:decaprenyl-phosphate phosphoribosyltransferase [Actinomycetota bacterium]